MKFYEALHKFNMEIAKEYGPGCELTKLGISKKLMDNVIFEFSEERKHLVKPLDFIDFTIMGVPLVVKEKENF